MIAETVRSHPRPGSNSNGNLVVGAITGTVGQLDDQDTTRLVVAAPFTSGGHPNSNAPGRHKEDDENLVAFHPTQDPISGPISHALGSEPTGSVAIAYPLARRGRDGESELEVGEANVYNTLRAGDGGSSRLNQVLTPEAAVRRLTPTECARLQGLPDDWFYGVPGTSDSKMYAGLGDAVTVNVAEWLGVRIAAA